MTNPETILLTELISELESLLSSSSSSSWKDKPNTLLPSASQLYRLGLVLSDIIDQNETRNQQELLQAYGSLLDQIPPSHLRSVLGDLHEAFVRVLETFDTADSESNRKDTELALKSMHGIYATNEQTLLAVALGHPVAGWSKRKMDLLTSVYNKFTLLSDQEKESSLTRIKDYLLSLMACFLSDPSLDFEQLFPIISQLQDRPSKYAKSAWEELVRVQASRDPQWKERLVSHFADAEQQDYLLSMFAMDEEEDVLAKQSSLQSTNALKDHSSTRKNLAQPAVASHQNTIQRLIGEVKSVFPNLGEGYIETALSHYHGDTERTISALVEAQEDPSTLPVSLQRLDPKLPGRWKGPTSSQSQAEEEEARRITQETVRAMERQQEEEARALEVMRVTNVPTHDEYDDDYDDQYDDIEGFMSNDHGLYDDFETVRTYNKMLKQIEEEQAFWDENRNVNRSNKKQSSTTGGDKNVNREGESDSASSEGESSKRYKGPDKIKGGRIPKPREQQNKSSNTADKSSNQGGRTTGKGGGRGGRAGRGGRGRANEKSNGASDGASGRGSVRHKQNKLASRKDKQKQAMAKRSG